MKGKQMKIHRQPISRIRDQSGTIAMFHDMKALSLRFATVTITEVLVTPEKTINAQVVCENIEPGRGGGGQYGTKGAIPGLVE